MNEKSRKVNKFANLCATVSYDWMWMHLALHDASAVSAILLSEAGPDCDSSGVHPDLHQDDKQKHRSAERVRGAVS